MPAWCVVRALLAAAGLLLLLWAILNGGDLLFHLNPRQTEPITLLLAVSGSGEGLEYRVRTLLCRYPCRRVILVDTGLTAEGRLLATLLCRRWSAVQLCTPRRPDS